MVSTLGPFGIVGVGLIGSEFGVAFCETFFVKSDRSLIISLFESNIYTLFTYVKNTRRASWVRGWVRVANNNK